ncbi:MAG: aldehyde dehydrogenase family protein [Acidobacteria bacterium]|nr:aldehyde dehydrogenase family protein [Acidobacteriota bacterium]
MREMKLFLAGRWVDGEDVIEVHSPYDGRVVSRVSRGGATQLEAAAAAAGRFAPAMARMAPWKRAAILERAAALIHEQKEALAQAISEEAGKPISLARGEAGRCYDTFTEAARVARDPRIETQDLGGFASGAGRLALIRRVPIGPVLAITPFNFPLNLVAHKVAPAIAAGCPVVLKPASQTPGPALMLAKILEEAGLPEGALSVIPSRGTDAQELATDDRFKLLTFTGSMDIGWKLKQLAWNKRVALEMGGNAAVVVAPDAIDLEGIAARIAGAAYGYAGQSCISVQRIYVAETIYNEMRDALVAAAETVTWGDPADENVVCGPVIDEANVVRLLEWIGATRHHRSALLTGGKREGNIITPTLLEGVDPEQPVVANEVFGPVAVLDAYEDVQQAIHMVNDSRYGLQAGIYTQDIDAVQTFWEEVEAGGIIHNDVPTWRTDPMPYGGVKASGVGREGPRYAYLEMTEERMLVVRR